MKTKFKSYGYYIGAAMMGIAIGSLLQFAKATWTEPALAPPNSNVGAPINTSANSQAKAGILSAGTLLSPTICIGTDCKSAWPSASGDNLGDHTATAALNMNGFVISNARAIGADMLSVASGSFIVGGGGMILQKVLGITFSPGKGITFGDGSVMTSANKASCQWESVGSTNTKTGGTISAICANADAVMRGFKFEGMGGGDHNAVFPTSIYCCR